VTEPGAPATEKDDRELVAALQRGDERAFETLVERYHASLVRVAMIWVRDRSVAEEVAQETWLGVLKGIDRFEGRSSLKTWLFRILANRARTRGVREARSIPLSALAGAGAQDGGEPTVSPERFLDTGDGRPGPWAVPPESWARVPEDELLGRETLQVIETAIAALPPRQQEVITLRDVEGLEAAEVAEHLGVSEGNQRVLLHRARAKVRAALEAHWGSDR
jgi:RNA polymerase sigma-70 factor (ECF subfamily)